MANATDLLRRDRQLSEQQTNWMSRWQDIADFVAPERQRILHTSSTGPEQNDVLYDSTAIHAGDLLASNIHGTMTPATQPWISYVMRDDELNDQQDVREWLEDVSKREHKALRQSNFSTSAHEFYRDIVKFGTGALFVEEKDAPANGGFGGFRFTAQPIGTYRVAEDKDGRVDTVFRDLKMSRRQCVAMWGPKCGQEFLEKASQKPDEIVEVLHAVYPRRDRAYDSQGNPKAGSKNLPWASCYVLRQDKRVTDEGGFEENPWMVARWSKIAGEVYGSGPSHTAIYDIKTLNAFVMFMLQAIPLAMQPPSIEKSDVVQGDLDRAPGGRIVADTSGPLDDSFKFLDIKYNPEVSETFRIALKAEIERQYHANELQLRESPQMTATEVQVRYELMQRNLGPVVGRLESEFLNPLAWRCFSIMARRGAFKELPQALLQSVTDQTDAADLDLEYEGPLARAQRSIEITAQDRTIAFVAGITQTLAAVDPKLAASVWDVLKLDKMIRDRAVITGLASDSLNSDDEVQGLRDTRDQAQEQQQKMAQAQQLSEVGRNITPMMESLQTQGKPQGKAA